MPEPCHYAPRYQAQGGSKAHNHHEPSCMVGKASTLLSQAHPGQQLTQLPSPRHAFPGLSLDDRLQRRLHRGAPGQTAGSLLSLPLPHHHELYPDLPQGMGGSSTVTGGGEGLESLFTQLGLEWLLVTHSTRSQGGQQVLLVDDRDVGDKNAARSQCCEKQSQGPSAVSHLWPLICLSQRDRCISSAELLWDSELWPPWSPSFLICCAFSLPSLDPSTFRSHISFVVVLSCFETGYLWESKAVRECCLPWACLPAGVSLARSQCNRPL